MHVELVETVRMVYGSSCPPWQYLQINLPGGGAGAISFAVVVPPVALVVPPVALLPVAVVVPPATVVLPTVPARCRRRAASSCRPSLSSYRLSPCCPLPLRCCRLSWSLCRMSSCCPLPLLCRPLPLPCRVVVSPVAFNLPRRRAAHRRHRAACRPAAHSHCRAPRRCRCAARRHCRASRRCAAP
jgi:hypothetical protein